MRRFDVSLDRSGSRGSRNAPRSKTFDEDHSLNFFWKRSSQQGRDSSSHAVSEEDERFPTKMIGESEHLGNVIDKVVLDALREMIRVAVAGELETDDANSLWRNGLQKERDESLPCCGIVHPSMEGDHLELSIFWAVLLDGEIETRE